MQVSEEIKNHIDKLNPAYRAKYPDALGWGWVSLSSQYDCDKKKEDQALSWLRFIVDESSYIPHSFDEGDLTKVLYPIGYHTLCDYQGDVKQSLTTEKHDSHYAKQEIQPIEIMEQIILTNVPEDLHEQVLLNFRLALGAKYVLRTGHKDSYIKELQKAQNYLKRAETGEWL